MPVGMKVYYWWKLIGSTEVANSKKLRSEEQKLTKNAPKVVV
jgi:hypothetical protein